MTCIKSCFFLSLLCYSEYYNKKAFKTKISWQLSFQLIYFTFLNNSLFKSRLYLSVCGEYELLLLYYLQCLTEVSQGYVKTLKITNSMDKLQYGVMNVGPFFIHRLSNKYFQMFSTLNFRSIIYLGRRSILKSSTVDTEFTTK